MPYKLFNINDEKKQRYIIMEKDEQLSDYDEKRRDFLVQALMAGAFWIGAPELVQAAWWGKPPYKLQNKSIFSMNGDVRVNGVRATESTIIRANDKIITGDKSNVIFAVGSDSFILRGNSDLQLNGSEFFLNRLRMAAGSILSVFGNRRTSNRPLRMETPTATIGIRGTGVYMEAEPDLSYLCTCYGTTQIASADDLNDSTTVTAQHHDQPKYITKDPKKGSRIRKAPFKNHTDPELKMLEALVGREVPFGVEGGLYQGPRRDY